MDRDKEENTKVLVVDDEDYTREYFKSILTEEGYTVELAADGKQALKLWSSDSFDLVIMDLKMPGLGGLDVLKKIREQDSGTMVIMISAYGDIDSVIDAMRLGANDFFLKPFPSMEKVKIDIKNCLERKRLIVENYQLRQQVRYNADLSNIVYKSKSMARVMEVASRAADLDMPVLVEGETGVGKELVARYIHESSSRKGLPFFAVNCGAVPENLLESTLFGHERGAFTGAEKTTLGYFEAANGGTVFLDEIGETTPSFQVKLLRVIQEYEIRRVGSSEGRRVNFRLISATNKDLKDLVKRGSFRKDLFYRINVIRIKVPPLRDRPEDIPVLLDHFMHLSCKKHGIKPKVFSPKALETLLASPWEGNVRELQNLVDRIVAFNPAMVVDIDSLPLEYKDGVLFKEDSKHADLLPFEKAKAEFERAYLKRLLVYTGNDIKKASELSGLDLTTLYRKKQRFLN